MQLKIIFISIILFSCCTEEVKKHDMNVAEVTFELKNTEITKTEKQKAVAECISKSDTTFSNGDYVKYVVIDSTYYGIELSLGGNDKLLGYKFDCFIPSSAVPTTIDHFGNRIVMSSGSGQQNSSYLYLYSYGGQIRQRRYIEAVAVNLMANLIAYIPSPNLEIIIVENLLSERKEVFKIPDSQLPLAALPRCTFNGSMLEVKYSNGFVQIVIHSEALETNQ